MDLALRRAYDIAYMNAYTPSCYIRTVKPEDMSKRRDYSNLSNPYDYLAQLNAMINHDIYKSASIDFENISNLIESDVLIVVSLQDHLVNPNSSIELAKQIGSKIVELTEDCGHIAVWCEAKKIKEATSVFLKLE